MVEGFIIVRTTLDFFFFLKLKMSTEKEKKYFYAKVPKLKKQHAESRFLGTPHARILFVEIQKGKGPDRELRLARQMEKKKFYPQRCPFIKNKRYSWCQGGGPGRNRRVIVRFDSPVLFCSVCSFAGLLGLCAAGNARQRKMAGEATYATQKRQHSIHTISQSQSQSQQGKATQGKARQVSK